MTSPFYIRDLEALRRKLGDALQHDTLMGRVWDSVRRRARNAPAQFPWFTPFAALVTGDRRDIESAKQAVRNYLGTLDAQSFGMGLQFHFWCFAFPHARWSLYFQWLAAIGAWDADEERQLREELLTFQYVNFFTGMRVKPEPECVDNQSMSLCFSNALLGHLFGDTALGQRMGEDGIRRLPSLIGGIPASGYSGEGSTYMDHVVGPSIPFIVELLEQTVGGAWFSRSLPPHQGSAEAVCRMIAREWMPNGLFLPWDHYGYGFPTRSCVAYAAHRTGDPFYRELLERHANWAFDQMIGWGFDDLVWSLVWWPEGPAVGRSGFVSWHEPEVGAALVSDDAQLYAMQMWDESTPMYPTRAHVNPNAVVLSAYGVPLTVDGITGPECTAFKFDDTWREVGYMDIGEKRRFNFGNGCGGSHSVLLVDHWEGMRASKEYRQATPLAFSAAEKSVLTEVSPVYREKAADTRTVQRRTRLCHERFWLIEDLAQFGGAHRVTARFFLRPSLLDVERGVSIETAEGVRLTLVPLVGSDEKTVSPVNAYPDRLDGRSLQVDFVQTGATCRWLWLAWPEATRAVAAEVQEGWRSVPDPDGRLSFEQAADRLGDGIELPLTVPPFLQRDLPVVSRWWFRRALDVPADTPAWLRLPRDMGNLRLWLDGEEQDLGTYRPRLELLEPEFLFPVSCRGRNVEVTLCCDTEDNQYPADGIRRRNFHGSPRILVPQPAPGLAHAEYRDGVVTVRSGAEEWTVEHPLLPAEGEMTNDSRVCETAEGK